MCAKLNRTYNIYTYMHTKFFATINAYTCNKKKEKESLKLVKKKKLQH